MCGILGVISQETDVAEDLYLGLWSLLHRGQESSGMVTYDNNSYHHEKGMGTVEVVFGGDTLRRLKGRIGIGHVRYSTTGESSLQNAQPIEGSFKSAPFWIAHNGNLTNTEILRKECEGRGYFFKTSTDTEVIAALIYFSGAATFEDALKRALRKIEGTYSLTILSRDALYAVRDATSNRPLSMGQGRGCTVFSSESAVYDVLGIKYVRDIQAGEIVKISLENPLIPVEVPFQNKKNAIERPCIFEYVYFLRPDSMWYQRRAQLVRERMGRALWQERPTDADIVVPVPDSSNFAGAGLAKESGLPLEMALFRSHYVGRTFIEPIRKRRTGSMRIKFNGIPELVAGKRVIVVDDSIVRGTTTKRVIAILRDAGAREIHMRVSSPQYISPCYYGIDTYRVKNELIAKNHAGNTEEIKKEIGADSLYYLSLDGMRRAITDARDDEHRVLQFCDACFTGNYHIPIPQEIIKS